MDGGASRHCDGCGGGMRAADACFGAHGELLCDRCGGSSADGPGSGRWHLLVILVTVVAPILYALTLR